MAQAYKCDRCEKLTEDVQRYAEIPDKKVFTEVAIEDFHLCGDCKESLDEFLDGVGLSRETDCRTERIEIPTPTLEIDWSSVNISGYNIGRDTCLKEMRELGGRNY